MQTVLPMSAGTLGSMLGPLLFNHPEMQTFMAEAPQVGRILRPLCRLVGLKPPDYLALPKHKRAAPPTPRLPLKGGGRLATAAATAADAAGDCGGGDRAVEQDRETDRSAEAVGGGVRVRAALAAR